MIGAAGCTTRCSRRCLRRLRPDSTAQASRTAPKVVAALKKWPSQSVPSASGEDEGLGEGSGVAMVEEKRSERRRKSKDKRMEALMIVRVGGRDF